MSKLDKAKESLIGKIDDLFGFNLSNRQDGISYDFGQYRLNKLYKPLVKYFIDQYMSHLEQYSEQEADKILGLFSDFFSLYYSNGDFGYFKNKFSTYQYRIPYSGKDTEFWRATKDCYYVKTSDVVNDMAVSLGGIFDDREVQIKMFKKTEGTKTDSGEDKYIFDTQIEDIVDEESEEVIGYKVTFINYEESKDTKKQKETMIADVLESKGIQYSNPAIKKSIDEFLKKRGRDYFIHKRLKAFLTEELERYFFQMLKTDIQAKADILSIQKKIEEIKAKYSDDPAVIDFKIGQLMKESQSDVKLSLYETSYLWILNFVNILADLEEFKAKLWNKKRKIVKQEYCINIGKIKELETLIPRREEMLKAIIENEAQIQEWEDLGMKTDSNYLENDFLVVDTKNFSGKIKEYLLELARSNEITGKLFQSDNDQALTWLKESGQEMEVIYIDPPYNTASSEIVYKNGYLHSSRISMMFDRLLKSYDIMNENGIICIAIDDFEYIPLQNILEQIYDKENNLGSVSIRINPKGRITSRKISPTHEYVIFYGKTTDSSISKILVNPEDKSHNYVQDSDGSRYLAVNLRKQGVDSEGVKNGKILDRHYPIYYNSNTGEVSAINCFETEILPIDSSGNKRIRRRGKDVIDEMYNKGDLWVKEVKGQYQVYFKFRGGLDGEIPKSIRDKKEYSASEYGTRILDNILGKREMFSYPKSPFAVMDCIKAMEKNNHKCILDFFAGSGTTGHAVFKLNREDGGQRKFILVELGRYFDDVTLKRIKKVMYSDNRKDGEARDNNGSQSIIEYTKLNQYEDWFNAGGYLDTIEGDINHLSNTDVTKIGDIKQVLFPLSQLKDRIYGLDDEIIG